MVYKLTTPKAGSKRKRGNIPVETITNSVTFLLRAKRPDVILFVHTGWPLPCRPHRNSRQTAVGNSANARLQYRAGDFIWVPAPATKPHTIDDRIKTVELIF